MRNVLMVSVLVCSAVDAECTYGTGVGVRRSGCGVYLWCGTGVGVRHSGHRMHLWCGGVKCACGVVLGVRWWCGAAVGVKRACGAVLMWQRGGCRKCLVQWSHETEVW